MPTPAQTYLFTQSIQMQGQRDRASSLGAIQIITFAVTTGMAILASFGAQYGGGLPLSIDWGAGVTALLLIFGRFAPPIHYAGLPHRIMAHLKTRY